MKILYVEDHEIFAAQVIRLFLSRHEVVVVPGIHAAHQALAAGTFDLMIVDYDLEDGKGDALVREIRSGDRSTPIIAASSHERGNAALSEAGASIVCDKLHFDQIQQTIDQLLPDS